MERFANGRASCEENGSEIDRNGFALCIKKIRRRCERVGWARRKQTDTPLEQISVCPTTLLDFEGVLAVDVLLVLF